MNHLRELLQALASSAVYFDPRWEFKPGGTEEVRLLLDDATRLGERAVCFAIGEINQAVALAVIPELCRLPYPICWFETEVHLPDHFGAGSASLGMLCVDEGKGFNAVVFQRRPGGSQWVFEGAVEAPSLSAEHMAMFCPSNADDVVRIIQTVQYGVKAFLSALHCSNVQRQQHTPDAKLQKARAKRGKAPLFSYWTLQLDGRDSSAERQGGTHAGPRVHLRRGHPRQYSPGKWTWVQAHAVGNRAAGMVHKDYSAGPALAAASGHSVSAGLAIAKAEAQ